MEILIVRQNHSRWGVDGSLYINRRRICDTVEHPTRHLPSGEYQMTNDQSQITNGEWIIPNPFRHGDGALASRHGEIIVGKTTLPGLVTQSQQTYDRLYESLKKAWQRGNTVQLRIVG